MDWRNDNVCPVLGITVSLLTGIAIFISLYINRTHCYEILADEYRSGYTYIFKCGYDHVDTVDADYDAMCRIVDTIECAAKATRMFEFHKECKTANTIYTITISGIYIEKERSGIIISAKTDKDRKNGRSYSLIIMYMIAV